MERSSLFIVIVILGLSPPLKCVTGAYTRGGMVAVGSNSNFLIKYDSLGNLLWARNQNIPTPNALEIGEDGSIYIVSQYEAAMYSEMGYAVTSFPIANSMHSPSVAPFNNSLYACGSVYVQGGSATDMFIERYLRCQWIARQDEKHFCSGQSYSYAGNTYTADGAYEFHYTSASGCDSTYYLALYFEAEIQTGEIRTICPGSSYQFGGNAYTVPGMYTDTFTAQGGCDSISMLYLLVGYPSGGILDTIFDGQTYEFYGRQLTDAGAYYDTIPKAGRCDSIVSVSLIVVQIDSAVTTFNGALSVAQEGVRYQWIDCSTGDRVFNERGREFVPTESGSYACKVSVGTSSQYLTPCVSVLVSGLEEHPLRAIKVYPNPSESILNYEGITAIEAYAIDMVGRKIGLTMTGKRALDVSGLSGGLYMLSISTKEGEFRSLFIRR